MRHAAVDGAGNVVDDAGAGDDAEPLDAALVDALWLVLLPQPAAATATAANAATTTQGRRTTHKQTRSGHRESP